VSIALRQWRHRLAHRAVAGLSTRPVLYYGVRRLTGTYDHLCIRPDTELVIEGYPRSANSTTAHGFLERQDRAVRVAHHKHHAAQLLRAARWKTPAIALIRPPRAAIVSGFALAEEGRRRRGGPGGRGSHVTFEDAARAWRLFYRAIRPYRDAFILAPFGWVTTDLEGVIQAVNDRFGTAFQSAPAPHPPQRELGWHARSTPLRREIQRELRGALEVAEAERPELTRMLAECDNLHAEFVDGGP
jgi:PAS domain-containing protein